MWSTVQNSTSEKAALFSLLDEYFTLDRTRSTTGHAHPRVAPRLPAAQGRSLPPPTPSSSSTTRPPTTVYSPSIPNPQPTPSSSTTPTCFQTTLADQALQQPALSSAALRQAGLSPKAAGYAAQFGAKHHTVLAPHVANAAQRGWNAQQQAQTGPAGGGEQQPRMMPPARGPKPPSGLSTTSAKSFGKAITSLQAPMPKHDPSKAAYTEPLATHAPIKANQLATPSHRTQIALAPPARTVPSTAVSASGLGRARVLYDYKGAEEEDLQINEGEVVTVVEHVSDEWWKCEAEDGRKGIVPKAYLESLPL